MNETMEKYLAALTAAVEIKDLKAVELLDGFATYIYHDIYARANNTTGQEQVVWNEMLLRVQALIAKMVKIGPDYWRFDIDR
jgi:hypothetical protein